MKTIKFLILLTFFAGAISCTQEQDEPVPGNDPFDIEGSFGREFPVGETTQIATYTFSQEAITYDLAGGFAQSNYDIVKEYYASDEQRWIGYRESNSAYYVIFFNNVSDTEISLYKKQVSTLEEGINEPVPAADNTDNYGWNTYQKDLPVSGQMTNLYAPQEGGMGQPVSGAFAKFDFETGTSTDSDTDWDIAFRGSSIVVNGGVSSGITDEPERNGLGAAYIATGTMETVTAVDTSLLVEDSADGFAIPEGSGNGWYTYDSSTHVITPTAGKILVFKTRDGKYAKVEILSYYKDAPASPDIYTDESRYYTFNYVYQPHEGVETF